MVTLQRIAIFGADGQVGSALAERLGARAILFTQAHADFSQPESLAAILNTCQPDAVMNAAAYTAVDKAEEEPELAHAVNAEAPAALARWCAANGVPLVHYSTDYVYDGSGVTPWRENDAKAPLNTYGASKLAGDEAIEASGADYLIFRTSWVYDAKGRNFLNTMLRLGAERESLRVVADQTGAPTYAPHLAAASLQALEDAVGMRPFPRGVYHLANAGETDWHGFAEAIFAGARAHGVELCVKTVEPIPSSAYPTPAKRPHNSRLDCSKIHTVFGMALPGWEQGLALALKEKYRASHDLSA